MIAVTVLYTLLLCRITAINCVHLFPSDLNGSKADSNLIADVDLMASQSLSERLPSIIIRQALRVWAKDMIRKV